MTSPPCAAITHHRPQGFTLMELVVYMALLAMTLNILSRTFIVGTDTHRVAQVVTLSAQHAHASLDLLSADIRQAVHVHPAATAVTGSNTPLRTPLLVTLSTGDRAMYVLREGRLVRVRLPAHGPLIFDDESDLPRTALPGRVASLTVVPNEDSPRLFRIDLKLILPRCRSGAAGMKPRFASFTTAACIRREVSP